MNAVKIGLIIIGVLSSIITLFGTLCGIAMIIAAPALGKLIGIFFTVGTIIIIIGLWMLILLN